MTIPDTVENGHQQSAERSVTIDIAKGICILLVVFGHINYTPELQAFIYTFHMPFFFLLSGMLFSRERYPSFGAFLKRKVRTLLCPFLFFGVLALILRLGFAVISYGVSAQAFKAIVPEIVNLILVPDSASVPNGPLWFLPCLFLMEILYYFISAMKKPCRLLVCGILTVVGWLLASPMLRPEGLIMPWCSDTALFAIGFFAIGHLLSPQIKKGIQAASEHKHRVILSIGVLLLCVVALLPIVHFNGKITLGSKILNNGLLVYCGGIIGSCAVLAASVLAGNCRFLRFCGTNSLPIMAIHYEVYIILGNLLQMLGVGYDKTSVLQTLLPFVAITGITLVCTLLYNKLKRVVTI